MRAAWKVSRIVLLAEDTTSATRMIPIGAYKMTKTLPPGLVGTTSPKPTVNTVAVEKYSAVMKSILIR